MYERAKKGQWRLKGCRCIVNVVAVIAMCDPCKAEFNPTHKQAQVDYLAVSKEWERRTAERVSLEAQTSHHS